MLQYADFGRVHGQGTQVFSWCPADQVKVILFDEFKSESQRIDLEGLDFVGNESVPYRDRAKGMVFRVV